jgi:hypothetical protein
MVIGIWLDNKVARDGKLIFKKFAHTRDKTNRLGWKNTSKARVGASISNLQVGNAKKGLMGKWSRKN